MAREEGPGEEGAELGGKPHMLEKLAASQGHAQAEEDEELLVAALLQKPGHPLAEEREEEDEGGPGAHPSPP